MTKPSMKNYIEDNDLEGAYSRFLATNTTWKDRWWNTVCEIFNSCKDWAAKFFLDMENRILKEITIIKSVFTKRTKVNADGGIEYRNASIYYAPDIEDNTGEEKAYHIKFYDEDTLLFDKIGTTTDSVLSRLKSEIYYYQTKNRLNVTKAVIHTIHHCGDVNAEGFESWARGKLIKRYPKTWKKNDRFFGVDIAPQEIADIYTEYASM